MNIELGRRIVRRLKLLHAGLDCIDNFRHPLQVELLSLFIGLICFLKYVHFGKIGWNTKEIIRIVQSVNCF